MAESVVMFECSQVWHVQGNPSGPGLGQGPGRVFSLILPCPSCCVLCIRWGDTGIWEVGDVVHGQGQGTLGLLRGNEASIGQKPEVCLNEFCLSSKWLVLFSQKILVKPWC